MTTPAQLERYCTQFNASPMLKNFGLRIGFPDLETVEVVLDPVQGPQRGGLGSDAVNGGILAAIFDLAIGCTPALVDPTKRSATVQLSINFMRAARGNRLVARGKIERAGGVLLFASAQLFDEKGALCATCSGLARLSDLPWANGESPSVN
jgi:uncharacterized protein (TIGR00369 family)